MKNRSYSLKQAATLGLFLLIIFIAGLLMFSNLTNGVIWYWGGDFAQYIMQAKSILDGSTQNFVEANRIAIEQTSVNLAPVAYPWGFPLLLAPVYALWGLNLVALKVVCIISYLLFLVVLWFGFRKVHPTPWFLYLMFIFTLNPFLISFSDNILSDLPFLLLSTLSIILIQTIVVQNRHIISNFWSYFLIGFVITSAFLVRSAGILLLVTLGISQVVSYIQKQLHSGEAILKKDRPKLSLKTIAFNKRISIKFLLLHLTPYVIFFFSITILLRVFPDNGNSYASEIKYVSIDSLVSNFNYYARLLRDFFIGFPYPYYKVVYKITIPLAIAGAAWRYKLYYPAIIYIILSFILYTIYPHKGNLRFLIPILPFYISFVLFGLEGLCNRMIVLKEQIRKPLCYLPVVLVILFFGFNVYGQNNAYVNLKKIKNDEGVLGPTAQEMYAFISNNTKSTDTIIYWYPRVMRFITGRQSCSVHKIDQLIRGDYLVFHPKGTVHNDRQVPQSQLESLITNGDARLVFENHNYKVYQLNKKTKIINNSQNHTQDNI